MSPSKMIPTHVLLESTPRLDQLATSIDLRGRKRVPVKEDTTLYIYDMPEQCADMVTEIHSIRSAIEAAIDWADIQKPTVLPQFFRMTSGVIKVKENHTVIIKAVGDPEDLAEARLRSWPLFQDESVTETKPLSSLALIRPLDSTQCLQYNTERRKANEGSR
ncbi:uncharacterized protein CC84DRAFT_1165247 [Paraphaeosphaeria sporulosa]|uniref:Uncharacterized protein n=1 Tax=Paraphaeosphaeria sporulosa TaxID=1460663 RepID=A0A177CDN7_9PLEO|nr:uncharacterized protein CC84DRAFT_1165247 [Paraphaeosphaeria sporulosa]OAG04878.1 hypothetical protein CC84DRAFT_1165247 [Paraphaeosphaeria sporulosa]